MNCHGDSYKYFEFSLEIAKGITLNITSNNINSIKQPLNTLYAAQCCIGFFQNESHTKI